VYSNSSISAAVKKRGSYALLNFSMTFISNGLFIRCDKFYRLLCYFNAGLFAAHNLYALVLQTVFIFIMHLCFQYKQTDYKFYTKPRPHFLACSVPFNFFCWEGAVELYSVNLP
jgi:hypothetical protein